jgi:hypothetical protein
MMTHLTAALVLPVLVADAGDDPNEIADIVRTAVEFGLELAEQVESQFEPTQAEAEAHAS